MHAEKFLMGESGRSGNCPDAADSGSCPVVTTALIGRFLTEEVLLDAHAQIARAEKTDRKDED